VILLGATLWRGAVRTLQRSCPFLAGRLAPINHGTPAAGRNAITKAAQSFMTAFPDLRVIMENILIEGERAEYHWTFIGTNNGPGGTGHRVRISGFEVWEIGADGLIAESQGSFDETSYQRQLQHGFEESLVEQSSHKFSGRAPACLTPGENRVTRHCGEPR
jgi:predicted ester cyclase